jgi:hypothetical protein
MFFRGSRYELVATASLETEDGRVIQYKRVRFIPHSEGTLPVTVQQGDRLDLISWQVYRDPEQFWRLCDASDAMRPEDLTAVPGTRLKAPIPVR